MKLLKKIISFFIKAKNIATTAILNVDKFIKEHKKQIKLLMSVLEALFPAKTGSQKMACVVASVCTAIGYEDYSEEVIAYVEGKCQKIYEEFKQGLE